MEEVNDTTRLAAGTALAHMFAQGYFSISTIDNIAKTFGVTCERKAYGTLHLLHCVHYNEMPAELLKELPGLIAQCLQGLEIDKVAVERLQLRQPGPRPAGKPEADVTPSRFLRFLGKMTGS